MNDDTFNIFVFYHIKASMKFENSTRNYLYYNLLVLQLHYWKEKDFSCPICYRLFICSVSKGTGRVF